MLLNSKWITYTTGDYKSADDKYGNPSPYFRKTFILNKKVVKAELFASALGVFKFYINGLPVSDGYLSPGWVDYKKKLPLIRYDITDKLKEKNALGVVLADGWAVGHLGSNYAFKRCGYSDRIEFTASVKIEYADGECIEISTDKTWRATSGAIRRSDIYMGEYVDGRLDLGDFSSYEYDDLDWDHAEETVFKFSRNIYLENMNVPEIITKHAFTPKLLRQKDNTYLYNVGQNIAGVLSLELTGDRGASVVLRHGELLKDGELYTENLRKAEATDTYVLSGDGIEKFRPLFTYHGFQYAQIVTYGNVNIKSITAEAMYSDLEEDGSFSCSDDLVNKIYQNALWGQRGNFLNLPTDCPQRDERLGWCADAQIFARSAMWNMNCRTFYKKYLADIRDAQLGNGVIPAVAPVPPVGSYAYTGRDAAAGWCEAIAQIPYDYYVMYGDERVIRDNLFALKRLISYYQTESPEYIRSGEGAYGDWLSLGNKSDISAVSTLYYAYAVKIAGWMCSVIKDSEEAYYNELFLKIKEAFKKHFINESGMIKSDTQSLYVIAYKFGIIDKEMAAENLQRKFEESNGKLTTGFLGIKFLLPTLCDIGRADLAYSILTSKEFPGWGYSVMNGATTVWEHWDSYTIENGIRPGMNSFNHYSFGSCTEWMYEYCLGIRPSVNDSFKNLNFVPYFDTTGKITHAKGRYNTVYGTVEVSWRSFGDMFEYSVSVPSEIKCNFDFGKMVIESETYENGARIFVLKNK